MTTSRRLSASLAAIVNELPDDGPALLRFRRDADPTAFAALVRRHGPMVFGVCRRMIGDHHLAEDAFQAVFVVLARRAEIVRPTELPQWLYGTAYRVARRARAMAARRQTRERTGMILPESAQHDRHVDDVAELLDDAISQLSPTLRDAVVLCELDGLSRADAAKKLGIAEGTLSSRLAAGRKKLAELLRNKQITMPTGALIAATAVPTSLLTAAVESSAPAVALSATVRTLVHGALAMSLVKKTALSTVAILTVMVAGAGWSSSPKEEPNRPSRSTLTAAPIPKQSTWERFKAICGDSPKAKKLYEEMLGDEAEAKELFEADESEAKAFKAYVALLRDMIQKSNVLQEKNFNIGMKMAENDFERMKRIAKKQSEDVFTKSKTLRVLFLGTRTVPESSVDIDELISHRNSAELVNMMLEDDSVPVKKLYAEYYRSRQSKKAKFDGVEIAIHINCSDLLPYFRKIAKDEEQPLDLRMQSMYVLGNHGDESDFKWLLSMTDDRRYCDWGPPYISDKNEKWQSQMQIRDIACSMSLVFAKELNLRPFLLIMGPVSSFYPKSYYVGFTIIPFAKDMDRDAAHAKAKPWIDAKLKELREKEDKRESSISAPIPKQSTWERFKAICGDSPKAKKLFEEMLGDEAESKALFEADESDATAFKVYSSALKEMTIEWKSIRVVPDNERIGDGDETRLNRLWRQKSHEIITRKRLLRTLFLATRPVPAGSVDSDEVSVLTDSAFMFDLMMEDDSAPMKKLFAEWFRSRQSQSAIWAGMDVAINFPCQELIPHFRKFAKDEKQTLMFRFKSMFVLGNHGDDDDLAWFLTLRDDRRNSEWGKFQKVGGPWETLYMQMRDVACTMAMIRANEEPGKYMFRVSGSSSWQRPLGLATGKSLQPFHDDKARDAAHAKAKAWLDGKQKEIEKSTSQLLTKVWPRFAAICGNTQESKHLFTEMNNEPAFTTALIEAMAGEDIARERYLTLVERTKEAVGKSMREFRYQPTVNLQVSKRIKEVVTQHASRPVVLNVLFLGSQKPPKDSQEPDSLWPIFSGSSISSLYFDERLSVPFRKLFWEWVSVRESEPKHDDTVARAVRSISDSPSKESLAWARTIVDRFKSRPKLLEEAIRIVGQSTDAVDDHRLEGLLDDRRTMPSLEANDGLVRRNQPNACHDIRDAAAFWLIVRAGRDPYQFGFMRSSFIGRDPASQLAYWPSQFFASDDQDVAWARFKPWWDSRSKRPVAKASIPLSFDELKVMFKKACGEATGADRLFAELARDPEEIKSLQRVMVDDRSAFDEYCKNAIAIEMIESTIMDEAYSPLRKDNTLTDRERIAKIMSQRRERIIPRMVIRHYFLGTRAVSADEVEPVSWQLHRTPTLNTILESPEAPAMRQLLASWLRQRRDRYALCMAFNDLTSRKIPEFGPVVREFLTTQSTDISAVGRSCFWLLQHGEKSDIPHLLRFADDRREYKSFEQLLPSMNRMNKIEKFFELRDIAVVAAMTIAGEDVSKYGFEMRVGELDKDHPTISVACKTIKIFETDSARDAAHAKAKAWIEAQKR